MNIWTYKQFFLMILVYWVLTIVAVIIGLNLYVRHSWYGMLPYYCSAVIHVLIDLSIVTTLAQFKEGWWRAVPLYVLMVEEVAAFVVTQHLMNGDAMVIGYFQAGVSVVSCLLCFYVFINMLLVQHKQISLFLKLYGLLLLLGITIIIFLPAIYLLHLAHINSIHSIVYSLLFTLHTIPLCILYYKLYKGDTTFNPGDYVVTNKALQNIAVGTKGIVVSKRMDALYEVEFLDDHGVALNAITVAAADLQYQQEADLQARINNFGK